MIEVYINGERRHENLNPTDVSDAIDLISSLIKIYSVGEACTLKLDILSKKECEEKPKKERKRRRTKAEMEEFRKSKTEDENPNPNIADMSQKDLEVKLQEHWVKTGHVKPNRRTEKMLEDTKGIRTGNRVVFYDTLRNRTIGHVLNFVYKGDVNPLDKSKILTFSGIIVEAETSGTKYLRKFDEVKKF